MDDAAHEPDSPALDPAPRPDEAPEAEADATPDAPSGPAPLRIDLEPAYRARVNYAMQQNGVAIVDHVAVTNLGAESVEGVTVTVSIESGVGEPWTGHIARLDPGATYHLKQIDLRVGLARLREQTEREATELVVAATVDGAPAGETRRDLEVLAANEWGGGGVLPELLAAFVTPNDPRLERVLTGARQTLRERTGSDALDGYQQRDAARAANIGEAIYLACRREGIGYSNPPASFEVAGQRVRLAGDVLESRLATCLDLALLLASAWEQAGLHPLIVIVPGHAFCAFWTCEENFAEATVDGPAPIRNRIGLGEIVPVEATLLTDPEASFAQSVDKAWRRLQDALDEAWTLDVRAARRLRIRPISQRIAREGANETLAVGPVERDGFTLHAAAFGEEAAAGPRPADRVDRWKRKLLDISLRNRLINFRDTKRTAPILCVDAPRFEDALASGRPLSLRAAPAAAGLSDALRGQDGDAVSALVREELDAGRAYLDLSAKEAEARLLEIYRDSRSALEETGANLLHVALGSLCWYESASSDTMRIAPLLLLPARLDRKAAGAGFTLSLSDESPRINVTLLQKLRSEFHIDDPVLGETPEDDSGVDVALVFNRFRRAIKHLDRWEVRETAHVGLFSFSKHLMWLDLEERTDDLRRSALVRRLIDGDADAIDTSPFEPATTLDDTVAPGDLLCPRDADSSQMVAVRAASSGRTFVLEGPPGTGKSQTIANLIADALGKGRRVLFVAEKRAALTVVRKRLGQDGLGPFCLELHSNRASKKEALAQMSEALELAGAALPSGWNETCATLAAERSRLNGYVRELHARRAAGESVFEVIARLAGLGEGKRIAPAIDDVASVDADTLARLRDAADALARGADLVGGPARHPLRGVGVAAYAFSLPDAARDAINAFLGRLAQFEAAASAWSRATVGEDLAPALSREGLTWLRATAALLAEGVRPARALLEEPDWPALRATLEALLERGRRRDAARADLLTRYRPELLERDLLPALDTLQRRQGSLGLVRWFTTRAVRAELRPLATGALATNARLIEDLTRAIETQRETKALAADACEGAAAFGRAWRAGEADWDALAAQIEWTTRYREAIAHAPAGAARERLIDAACERATEFAEASRAVLDKAASLDEAERALDAMLALTEEAWGDGAQPGAIAHMRDRAAAWRDHIGRLPDWCHWRAACDAAPPALHPLVRALEIGEVEPAEAGAAFERAYGERWLRTTADRIEAIRAFTAASHEATLERFRALDERVIELTKGVIRARLAARVPHQGSEVSAASEMGVLRREMEKKRRHLPVRQLVQRLPNLLPRIKPCFLMSPLSVAQYLDPSVAPFDLVVFDEASQIPVWDAVGAIARGADVVVVGDSKQLPPTNFFDTIDDGADDETPLEEEDLESILQECSASGVPSLRLLWHYRSRHESLIAFSNHHYYDNRLHTFPSPVEAPERLGVSMRHLPNAEYDRGVSRTNRVEAEAVADEVVRLLTDPAREARPTIGVVTFNIAQQRLIEDLLDQRRRENAALEPFFTEGDEPVFVKNLENVQGDERDVILFSITFGPDETGRVSMNFGPLNKQGGERRLNVAITRARERVVVFSALTADRIDLGRTDRLGVKHLKTFLDYAQRGPRAIAEAAAPVAGADFESPFERAVHDALTQRGWTVDRQVGCSAYRIDLAVRHPEKPGRYLLGVECDGPSYHSAATARDRDRIRQAVLERLGWRIHRVWSTDWLLDPARCLDRIDEAIASALRGDHRIAQTPDPAPQRIASAPVAPPAGQPAPHAVPVYTPYRSRATTRDRQDFHDDGSLRRLVETLVRIVNQESPVLVDVAMRRLADAWGVERMTQRAQDRAMDVVVYAAGAGAVVRRSDTLWAKGSDPDAWLAWRTPGDGEDAQRDIEHIPVEERAAAAAHVLERQIALPEEELEREAARLLGVGRMSDRSRDAMREGVAHAIQRGLAVRQGDRIAHPD
jgi:very-short-patch-repair endonuclease